jgi:hypothetical protein
MDSIELGYSEFTYSELLLATDGASFAHRHPRICSHMLEKNKVIMTLWIGFGFY